MPINHLFDENAPFPEEAPENPELAMTESPAPDMETLPQFPETDALEDGGGTWPLDAPAPDWNGDYPADENDETGLPAIPLEDGDAPFGSSPPDAFFDSGGASEDGAPDFLPADVAGTLEDSGAEDEPEIPYGEESGEPSGEAEPAEPETREENAVIRRPRAGRNAPRERSGAASDRAAFFGLDFNGLDRSLTPEQRKEWNSIYASYRGRSVMSGKIVGVDRAQVQVRNPQTGILETRRIFCAVVIPFRVRIIIPEMEMWIQGEERPGFVLRNTPGASVDFVIIRVDRENNLAVASRRMALSSRRYYFSTQPSMNRPGSRIQCGVMAVGPRRCLVNCNGYDIDLSQRDLSYASVPDLREAYHPGDVLDCVVKEYDSRTGTLSVSVKEMEPNPFDGAEFRHPEGCTREAVISGKYGGGVFCTLPDNVTVMCNYAFHYDDSTFQIGDRVLVQIQRYEMSKKQVYGKIVAKW